MILDGKTALVTGGACWDRAGNRSSVCRARLAKVALNHLPDDRRGPDTVGAARARVGLAVIGAPGDVSRPGAAEAMVRDAIETLGRLDYPRQQCRHRRTPCEPIPPQDFDGLTRGILDHDPDHQSDRPVPLHARGGGRR